MDTPSAQTLDAEKQSTPRIVRAGDEHLSVNAGLAEIIWRACYPGIITQAQID